MQEKLYYIYNGIWELDAYKVCLSIFMATLIMCRVGSFSCLSFLFGGHTGGVIVAADQPGAGRGSRPPDGTNMAGRQAQGREPMAANNFDYGAIQGPHSWNVPSNNQSPINIDQPRLQNSYFGMPLEWINWDVMPAGIRLENNGHTLVIYASYPRGVPTLGGGNLLGRFEFREIRFRWGSSDHLGSEHTVDNIHFPLEMQCLLAPSGAVSGAISSQSLLMVSYMFELGADNPYLDVLIQHLVVIKKAGRTIEVPPFPISYLMTPFYTQFFSYQGSLTQPPCHRGVEWLINPNALTISKRQLNEIRQLRSHHGTRIGCNARPVQPIEDRTVYYNQYRRQ